MRRLPALLAALAAAAASTTWWAPAAAAAACPGTSGVTVVVDYGALGGVQIGCAPGDPASGMRALVESGNGFTSVNGQPGLICKINAVPNSSCGGAPPTNAYWSYWHAPRGGSWTYSSSGAGSRNPAPGTVEGWAFGAGTPPGVAPPARPAPPKPTTTPPKPRPTTTAPKPTTTRPGQPQPTTTRTTPGAKPTTTTAAPGTSTTPPTGSSGTATPPTTTATSSSGAVAPGATTDVQPQAGEDGGGSTTGFLVGVGAVVVIGGLAVGAARRRAKADP